MTQKNEAIQKGCSSPGLIAKMAAWRGSKSLQMKRSGNCTYTDIAK
jgi:hypothetical protein